MVHGCSMREAAELCGVSPDTIKRRRRSGSFPNARLIDGAWQIPSSELAQVASAEGWSFVMLPQGTPHAEPEESDESAPPLHDAVPHAALEAQLANASLLHQAELAKLAADIEHQAKDLDRVTRERDRAQSDNDHNRAELERLRLDLAEATAKARAQIDLIEELKQTRDHDRARADDLDARAGKLEEELAEARSEITEARSHARWRYRRQLRSKHTQTAAE